jgi:regulator of CtrA degradation
VLIWNGRRSWEKARVQETAFFGKTYAEAMELLTEARDYLAHREPIDRETLMPVERLQFCGETMRLTARLTQNEALGEHCALAEHAICMEVGTGWAEAMPRRLAALLDRSQRLYVRVARLDELARRQIA